MALTQLNALDDRVLVAGQIRPVDMAALKAQGVAMVINNRPDDEEAEQPSSAEMEAAARSAGLGYRHIPVAGGFSAEQVDAMADSLTGSQGKTLAFCRSGTRSTYLWALAEARRGVEPELLAARAAAAGYDLSPIRSAMFALQGQG